MATNVNLGKQQITIYPYQEITSVNANQILYNLVRPGVSNVKVEVYSPLEPSQFGIKIYAGATMIFEQNLTENGVNRKFLVKCVLEDDVTVETFTKSQYWGNTTAAEVLYVYADLNYDLNSDARYAKFGIAAEKDVILDGQNLILATLLNHQYYVKEYNSIPEKKPDLSLNYYYVSYQDQLNGDVLPKLYDASTSFTPVFQGNLTDVVVPAGVFIAGNTIVSMAQTTVQPPAKITSFPVGKTADDMYQIDILRLKVTKSSPRVAGVAWESMVLDKPTPTEQWVWSAAYGWTESKLLGYLTEKNLTLQDSGHILLILVRASNAIVFEGATKEAQYPTWATVGFNKIHPSICYIPKSSILRIDEQDLHSRMKVPSYTTADVVIDPTDV